MTIVVDHPRYERFVGTYDDGKPPHVIRLEPGRYLEGTVFSADGSETAEATVCVRWEDEASPPPLEVVSRCADASDDGRFAVSGLSAFAEAEVLAEAPGSRRATTAVAGDQWPVRPLSLRLAVEASDDEAAAAAAASGSIRVQVFTAAGDPVNRFTMRVLNRRHRSHRESIWNAEQGADPVVVPIPGNTAGGGLLQIRFQAENHLLSEAYRLYPAPGRVIDLGAVYLNAGAVVSGRLFDAIGSQPVAGCLLELVPAGSGRILHSLRSRQHLTISDGEGGFLLGGLTEGRYYLRTECRTGPPTVRLIVLDTSEHADLGEIWMPWPRSVHVTVLGATEGTIHVMDRFREVGTPLATALLRPPTGARAREPMSEDRDNARSVADVRLAPGRYRIDLRDFTNGLLASKEILVNDTADRISVDLEYRWRTIRSVLTFDGRPVSGGLVRFDRIPGSRAGAGLIQIDSNWRGTTNTTSFRPSVASAHQAQVAHDGSFVVEGAPEEYLWMTWFAADGRSRVGRIWPDQPLSQLDLGGISGVAGELRQAASGVLTAADVVLIGELGLEVAGASTSENGHFVLPPAPPGRYRLLGNTGSGLANAELVLNADEPPPFQILQADEEGVGTIDVELSTPGAPLVGAWMHVLGPDETLAGTRLVVEDGVYRAEDVPAGEVTVLWNHGGACVGADKVTLEAGRSARLDRVLHLGRLLELRCSDRTCAGQPLSLVRVTTEEGVKVAHHLTGALPGTTFSDDGRVGLGCLTPGAYTVSLWADERRWDAEFELDPGPEETPVTVTIRPSAG